MNFIQALILGIVEGLTEFLPISSTGHLILAKAFLNLEQLKGLDEYLVVIQLGPMLAVLGLYFRFIFGQLRLAAAGNTPARRFLGAWVLAVFPVMLAGLLLNKIVEDYLFGPVTVAIALIVGGLVMLVAESWYAKPAADADITDSSSLAVTYAQSLWIGLAQCLALIPGTSRAMTTIVCGRLTGLSARHATMFSFLLALPVLFAASVFKSRHGFWWAHSIGLAPIAVGLVTSFLVAWVTIATFLKLAATLSFRVFGVYRIAIGVAVLLVLAR